MQVAGSVGIGIRGTVIGDAPLVVHALGLVPGTAVLLARLAKAGTGLEGYVQEAFPIGLAHGRRPQSLGLRPAQHILAKTLQLFAVAAVQKFVIFPIICGEFHCHSSKIFAKIVIFGERAPDRQFGESL